MPTDPARVQAAFLAVADLADPAARAAGLDRECAGDPVLRARVEALLKAHNQPDSLFDAVGETRTAPPVDPDATQADSQSTSGDTRPFLGPPARPDALGRLGHYEMLAVLGRGGFGTVYRAFDDTLHRVVAVKVLAPELAASGSARARFLREARAAAAVRDDHVVNIHAIVEEPTPYLVMEYVGGLTLQDKLDKTGPLGVPEILRIGAQIARGLAAAHAQGLIHRDIKPANILLENGVERVKITDFGLARAADDASISQSGVVAGTPMYMSPEQARGETIDVRSDLFSLGSVLYALGAGHPPFRAESTLAVLKRVVEDRPRPIREVNPDVPDWLEAIVAKLHAKEPGDRFQSAREVADLLQQHLAHRQQPGTVPMPAPVAVPSEPAETWRQIFEGTDYRRRLTQFGVAAAMFIPVYLLVTAIAAGWLDGLSGPTASAVLFGFLGVHVGWSAASLWLLARLKHGWQVPYKGRTLRVELSSYGSERLLLDGQVLAKVGWGLTFHELEATIPDGPGAGDRVRVIGQYGFLTPTCRVLVAEGPRPAQPPAWKRAGRWTRKLVWAAFLLVPIGLVCWWLLPQGWIMVKTDDPEMVVMLDGQFFVGGDNVQPDSLFHMQGRSLRMGEHTIRAVRGGRTVFEETFRLGFGEQRDFDLTRAGLAGTGSPPTPAAASGVYPDPGSAVGFKDRLNQTVAIRVTGQTGGAVWGTDLYTIDSTVAAAAVHAGTLKPGQTGIVQIKILPGLERYDGSTRNGVQSLTYAAGYPVCFRFVGVSLVAGAPGETGPVEKSLRDIGIAMHMYMSTYGTLPTPASVDAKGFPLLSWRVHLLPYLDQDELYKQFKLDEPWDSPHNRKLIDRIPPVYALGTRDGKTSLVVPVGGDTIFPGGKGIKLNELANGASNTVMVVQCDDAHRVIWTKPDDWPFNPYQPRQGLPDVFWVIRADGQVVQVRATLEPGVLRSILVRFGGKPVPADVWIKPGK